MLRERLKNYNLILASGSPRRQQFFRELDVDFEIRLKEVEEVYPAGLQREEITNYLAELKAAAFDQELKEQDILVTSDTIVWHQGRALGKPTDFEDAIRILKSLSGATHEVYTSVCFSTTRGRDVIQEKTEVTFRPLEEDEIIYYLEKYKPFDKAGAYGIQDWIGLTAVTKINGSYANVMGMPMDKVFWYLKNFPHAGTV